MAATQQTVSRTTARPGVRYSGPMKFHATIEGAGKTAAGIHVPNEVVAALGPSRKPAIKVTINGYTHRTTVATVSGRFMFGVPPEFRAGAGVAAGDSVEVEIELDLEPREVALPNDFAQALKRDAAARRTYDALSYSNKRRLVEPISAAKAAETRDRRIAKTVAMLHEGRS
jgi:hypothetical protein